MPISDGLISARQLCTDSIVTRHISPDTITPTEVLTGFNFVELVTVLPTTGNFEGRMVYLTTDDKLYRHDGAAFLLAVDGADITAATISGDRMIANTITAGQIAVGTITATEIAANTITAAEIAANTITATQIAASTITATELNVTSLDAITATMGTLNITNNITFTTGGVLRTAMSGQRVELRESNLDSVFFYSGDSFEASPGFIRSIVSGSGATRTLATDIRAPITTGDTVGTFVVIRTESFNDSTTRPGVVFGYGGGSAQAPLFLLQNNFDMRFGTGSKLEFNDLGTAAAPTIGIGTNFDDGVYSPADSELEIVTAGTGRMRFQSNGRVQINLPPTTGTAVNTTLILENGRYSIFRNTSLREHKNRINYNMVDKLAAYELRPAKFYRKDDQKWFLGLIADDLADQDPLLGVYDEIGDLENYDHGALFAVIAAKLNRLESKVAVLEAA